MSKNTKIILNYPNYQNIITQYLNLEEFKEKANDTMRSKRITITAFCNYLGDNGLDSIELCQQRHVSDFMENISPLSTTTKSGKAFILRHFFNYLYSLNLISYSGKELFPVIVTNKRDRILSFYSETEVQILISTVDNRTISGKRDLIQCPKDFTPYIFSKEEICRILKYADHIGPNKNKFVNTPYVYPAILRILYGCGSRISETVQLKIEDVDLSEGIITFHNGKNKVARIVPMSDSLSQYLAKYNSKVDRTGNNYFFPALHGECYSPITIRKAFRKLLIKAEIPLLPAGYYPRIHDLRHTFAVHALEQSIDQGLDPYCSLPALSTFMGHKGIESTEYYLRLTKHYFINTLNYTQAQADIIFPEV